MQASFFPGRVGRFDFEEVNHTIQHGRYAHSHRTIQCVQPGNIEAVVLRHSSNGVSHEAKRIQASGEVHQHRMKPVLTQSSLKKVEPHKLMTENKRMRNATIAAAA